MRIGCQRMETDPGYIPLGRGPMEGPGPGPIVIPDPFRGRAPGETIIGPSLRGPVTPPGPRIKELGKSSVV